MRWAVSLLAAATFFLGARTLEAQALSSFGAAASNGGGWTYDPVTSTISGTENFAALIYGVPLAADIGLNHYIQLSANVATAPAGSFTITLEDNLGRTAIARFQWSQFSGGATQAKPINFTTFNFNNIVGWSLDSGGSLQAINATLFQMQAVAVPEPSTYAIAFTALLGLWIARREFQKHRQPARIRFRR